MASKAELERKIAALEQRLDNLIRMNDIFKGLILSLSSNSKSESLEKEVRKWLH